MFTKRIELNSASNASMILASLRDQCTAAGLSPEQAETVIAEVTGPLTAMIQNGRAVASSNGQFRASRKIVLDSATVKLDAQFGVPQRLFARILKAFRRGGAR